MKRNLGLPVPIEEPQFGLFGTPAAPASARGRRRIGFTGPINRVPTVSRRGRLYFRTGSGILLVVHGADRVVHNTDRVVTSTV